jgi:hypothetical protein
VTTIVDELALQLSRALKSFAEQTLYVDSGNRLRDAYGR